MDKERKWKSGMEMEMEMKMEYGTNRERTDESSMG